VSLTTAVATTIRGVRVVLLAALMCAMLAGCSGDSESSAVATSPTTAPAATTESPATSQPPPTTTASSTADLRVYFLQDGKLAATSRRVAPTVAVGRAALGALAGGPSDAEQQLGFTTACVDSQLDRASLAIADGEATIEPPLDGACRDQAAWTLLQFPTVERVNGATREDLEGAAPGILVDSPAPFERVSSPLRVTGTANTYEATFEYDLLDSDGRSLAHHFVTATSGNGTRGTFDVSIPFDVSRAVDGEIVVYESSAEDGSRIKIRRIPLRLEPS